MLSKRTLSFAQAVLAAGVDRTKEDDEMPARLTDGHLHLLGVLYIVPVRHHELADVLLVFFGVNVQEDRVCTLPMNGILAPATFISVVCCSASQLAACDAGERACKAHLVVDQSVRTRFAVVGEARLLVRWFHVQLVSDKLKCLKH